MTEAVDLTASAVSSIYSIVVAGPPIALPRSRHWNGGWFHKRKDDQKQFVNIIKQQIPKCNNSPLYPAGVPICMLLKFYFKKPKRGKFPICVPVKPDIDNLAKFVLDSCNKVLYNDDSQVVLLLLVKLRDDVGDCNGRTVIEIKPWSDSMAACKNYGF